MARVISRGAGIFLANLIDYAGLFPPAELDVRAAAEEYARVRRSPEAWMLGRFVVPASRLDELLEEGGAFLAAGDHPWRLAALVGANPRSEAAAIAALNARPSVRMVVETVELRASTPREVDAALAPIPGELAAYVELPTTADLAPLLKAVSDRGARAKVRTGGVTPRAIPPPDSVARFLVACAESGVAFKATAGLHHPVRSLRPLTYAPNGPRAVMHGFLNVFAAGALAREGGSPADVEEVLREEDPEAFVFHDDGLTAGSRRFTTASLVAARSGFALAFGSCSFAEPVSALEGLGIL
jgi:hypothetical protein